MAVDLDHLVCILLLPYIDRVCNETITLKIYYRKIIQDLAEFKEEAK